jgi:NDP-sugar pyrophosphorylase family protein
LKALVLAAGEGTRLRPLTFIRQKPMTPVGVEPEIFYLLSHLAKEGFDEIIIVIGGPLKQQIIDYLGDGSRLGVRITYVLKPDGFNCGTAGSLQLASHLLDETFLVAQGDTLTEIPLGEAMRFHQRKGSLATIVLTKVEDPTKFGVAVLDEESEIVEFQEKPNPDQARSNLVSTGFYVLQPESLDYLVDEKWDFAKDLFPRLLQLRKKLGGFVSDEFWVDIGSLEGYLEGVAWALGKTMEKRPPNFVATGAAGQVLVEKGAQIGAHATITGPALIESGAIIEDSARIGQHSVIKKGAHVSAGAILQNSMVMERAEIGRGTSVIDSVVGESAVLGADVFVRKSMIGAGSNIGDRAKLLDYSRTWPNSRIGTMEVVSGDVVVPVDKAFYFFTGYGQYTGTLAFSLTDFIEALKSVPVESILFHTKGRDFERWARDVLSSDKLAEELEGPRRGEWSDGEAVRKALVRACKRYADEFPDIELELTRNKSQSRYQPVAPSQPSTPARERTGRKAQGTQGEEEQEEIAAVESQNG